VPASLRYGSVVLPRSTGRRIAAAIGAPLLLVSLLSLPRLGTTLIVSRPLAQVDAVISLASHEWERLPLTARIASDNPEAIVLLTLPQPVTLYNCHDCDHRIDRLRLLGVAETRVRVLPIKSTGTHGEALAALAFARDKRIRTLLVVTSPYHTRRALATFAKVFQGTGIEIGVVPANDTSPANPGRWWWAAYDRAYVGYEWAAIVYYWCRYGV